MSGQRWAKFFWSDWLSEPTLRACSYAARGLWMDLLSIAGSNEPVGYVALGPVVLDTETIAQMTGGKPGEVERLLQELEAKRVFSRDRRGCIYSRRMVSAARKSAIARENGKMGGNPTLRKETASDDSDKLISSPYGNGKSLSNVTDLFGSEVEQEEAAREPAKRRRKCPETWAPGPSVFALADREGFSADQLERELSKMRNHEFQTPRSDWDGVARNWLMTAAETKITRANGHDQRANAQFDKLQRVDAAMRAAAAGPGLRA